MDSTRKLEFFIFLASTVLAGYIYLNAIHAPRQALIQTEFELRAEIADGQAKGYAEVADYYRNIEKVRTLEPEEEVRKEYTAEQAVKKQEKVEKFQDVLIKLETE